MSLFDVRGITAPGGVAGAVVGLIALLAPSARAAQQVTVVPSADTFVSSAEPTYNYGSAGALEVSGAGASGGEFQGLMRFDLSAAKATFDAAYGAGGWKLDSASLKLTTSAPNNPIFSANAAGPIAVSWMQNDAWVEGTGGPTSPTTDGVASNTLPSFLSAADEPAGTINFPGGTSGTNTYALAPSAGFTGDVLSGGSLSLRFSATGSTSYLFSSRTFNQVANRPVMTLTASPVPEPAAGMALVAATGMLLARRRRGGQVNAVGLRANT
jgi:hypothetical protein